MNYLVSLVALASAFKRGVGGGCFWINSHKESGSRLLSRSTAEGPSHQKLMSYLDHAVSSALCSENTAGLEWGVVGGRVHPPSPSPRICVCFKCFLWLLSAEGDQQLRKNKAVLSWVCSCSRIVRWKCLTLLSSSFFFLPFLSPCGEKKKPPFDSQCNATVRLLRLRNSLIGSARQSLPFASSNCIVFIFSARTNLFRHPFSAHRPSRCCQTQECSQVSPAACFPALV